MSDEITKIGIAGCTGRVGQLLIAELNSGAHEGLEFSGGLTNDIPSPAPDYFITSDINELLERSDAIIDFTRPEATMLNAEACATHKKPIIIGTTGLDHDQESRLEGLSSYTPIVYTANMSIGVNLLLALVEQAAEKLSNEWDIDIFESHHKYKVDAPSGTALALGKAAAQGRGVNHDDVASYDRTGAREQGEIGYAVSRGGDVVGEHTVYFYSEGERLELTHKATNRALFARGALHATRWALSQKPGIYSMKDILGL